MRPALEVRSVWKTYGATTVLRDVSFALAPGSIATITGRSGSGKSTLFRLLGGLDRPSRGEVLVDGVDISHMDDAASSQMRLRHVGLVFQSFNLLPDLTVLENVRLPLDIAGVPRGVAAERAADLLRTVQLEAAASRLPNRLSGGEAQRTAIARALANRPSILLADEPTGSLDRANADIVIALIERINREVGTTVLIISHDPLVIDRIPTQFEIDDGEVRLVRSVSGRSPRGAAAPIGA